MTQLVLTDMNDAVVHELRQRAALHRRTPEQEAAAILSEVLTERRQESWTTVDAIYCQLAASGRAFADSAEMLREDRDR